MGSFKYRQVCDLQFYHAYFNDRISRKSAVEPVWDLDIVPAPETARLFKKHLIRCYFRQPNGVSIYGEVEKNAADLEFLTVPLKSTDKWVLVVTQRNPDYMLCSNMPLNPAPDACLYLTNATGDQAAPAGQLHLTTSAAGVDWNTDMIPLHRSPVFTYQVNGPLNADQAVLVLKNSTYQLPAAQVIAGSNMHQAVFNLQDAPSGCYTLRINGAEQAVFYFLNGWTLPGSPLAVIELYWNNAVTNNYLWQNANGSLRSPAPEYRIDFAARDSIWKYRIAFNHLQNEDLPLSPRDSVSNLSIQSDQNGEIFAIEQETDNRHFWVAAQQPLSWHESPQRRLTLRYDLNDKTKEREPLPHPTPDSLHTDPQSNQPTSSISLNQ